MPGFVGGVGEDADVWQGVVVVDDVGEVMHGLMAFVLGRAVLSFGIVGDVDVGV